MTRETVHVRGGDLAVFHVGSDSPTPDPRPLLIWAHGWGQTHAGLLAFADTMRHRARSTLLDLPGFGASPPPPFAWSSADYADAIAEWLRGVPAARRILVGYSFGCRAALQLAARHPGLVDGLFLVASPGLPLRRSLPARVRLFGRRWAFRLARRFVPEGPARERLRARFGSADYREAEPMLRAILVKAVNTDLSEVARTIRCPVVLVYGDRDRDTPLDIGERLHELMPHSRLVVLRGFDHLDIVTDGRHQLAQLLIGLLEQSA